VHTANAQFTVLPQVGFENSRTSVAVNDQKTFSPLGGKVSPQAAIRLDYKFKKAHGPFLGLATSRSIVEYGFTNPEAGRDIYTALRGNTQLRLEGGYQVSTKPIYFKKAPAAKSASGSHYQKNTQQSGCGKSVARTSCGSKAATAKAPAKKQNTRTWMRIQPSLGVAYIPGAPGTGIYTKSEGTQTVYQYNAGNWTTAVMSGIGFEFGSAAQSKFLVSLNYVKGVGNLDERSVTTMVGNKPAVTNLKSDASSWNLRMGIPISFAKKQPVVKQQAPQKTYKSEKRCGEYKMQYKSRCTRVI
jgi:hypothetical protein